LRPLTLHAVLAATDLTDGSAAAVQTASALARLTEARLIVLHAVPTRAAETEDNVADWLRQTIRGQSAPDEVRIVVAEAADVIAEHAEREGADVIVLGPHRQLERTGRLGSTADRVVRRAQTPCLVVPKTLPLPLGRVLVPLDLTEASCGALMVGLSWASALRRPSRAGPLQPTELDVIHVATSPGEQERAQRTLHEQVEHVQTVVTDAPGVLIRERVEAADNAAGAILRHVNEGEVDLAVLGTHGRPTAAGDLLGSTSSAVVRRCRGPVLLVPPTIWREHAREAA
jgi:nucleotide-binding universal stress UspA family protein